MFQRFHTMREQREGGFTLIELLVVILIIAILAAIAIPVFLRQREKAWREQVESALKNAATAQESYATDHNGDYTTAVGSLQSEGLKFSATDVTFGAGDIDLDTTNNLAYCMHAESVHDDTIDFWYYSGDGRPMDTQPTATEAGLSCPAA